ncbi:MAG: hypothetical protein JNL75_11200 [Chitinophagales bacterium]|nr:hypothetical protein [Chitinophagales bacterium]
MSYESPRMYYRKWNYLKSILLFAKDNQISENSFKIPSSWELKINGKQITIPAKNNVSIEVLDYMYCITISDQLINPTFNP